MANDNEVEIKVTGTNTSGPALKGAKDDTDKLGTAAEKTSAKLKLEAEQASVLERKLLELKATARTLGEEFKRTGNTDVLKSFNKTTGEASALDKFAKDFKKLGTDTAKVAEDVGKDIADGVGNGAKAAAGEVSRLSVSLDALPGAGQVKAIAIALAAIPAVAAGAGAAMAAIGLGGIAAGIVGAVKQAPAISRAFNAELDKVEAAWERGSANFIGPTLNAVHMLGVALNSIPIEHTLSELSQYTDGIAAGVTSAIASIGTGVTNLIHDAAPVLKTLGPDIAQLGTAVGNALNSIGSGAKGDSEALSQIIHVAGVAIETIGTVIGWFGKAYDALDHFSHGVTDVFDKIANFMPWLKPLASWFDMWDDRKPAAFGAAMRDVTRNLIDTGDSASVAANDLKALNDAMDGAINRALSLEDANVAVAAGFDGLAKAVDGHKRSLDINSDAGRTNIGVVEDMIRKLEQQRQTAIETGDGSQAATDKANAAFARQVAQLEQNLVKLGFNKAAVDALIQSLNAVPSNLYTTIHISTVGGDALDKAHQQGRQERHGGVVGAAAAGGPRTGRTLVGEDGPEIADLAPGTMMHTAGDSARLLASAGGGQAGGPKTFRFIVDGSGAGEFGRAMAALLRDYVHIQGGDGSVLGISTI